MHLEDIGFYTLSDKRAMYASGISPLSRCEILLTKACNFSCPYCRTVGPDIDISVHDLVETLVNWSTHGLKAVRFSGGEPLLHPSLERAVAVSRSIGVERIAVSTNGSLPWEWYVKLIVAGVNDFSVSLDACCASTGKVMSGGTHLWDRVCNNIRSLAQEVYTTVGVVVTETNLEEVKGIIELANGLHVSDIRVIPAAQYQSELMKLDLPEEFLKRYPILAYRIGRAKAGLPVRGLSPQDSNRCGLVLDDMAVSGGYHYPCIIYLREGGPPIGRLWNDMNSVRNDRTQWMVEHNTHADPICRTQCLDVCVEYNNKYREYHR